MILLLFILSTSTENDEEKGKWKGLEEGGGGEGEKTTKPYQSMLLFHTSSTAHPQPGKPQHALLNDRHNKTNSTAL